MTSLLGGEVLALLPAVVRGCITEPCWWRDELVGLQVLTGLSDLSLPDRLTGYRRVETARSRQWPRPGHALVHESSIVHQRSGNELIDTGEVTVGCVIADGTETGVRATVMPGRRIVETAIVPPNTVVMRNC